MSMSSPSPPPSPSPAPSRYLDLAPDSRIPLPAGDDGPASVHVIDEASIEAINAALAIGRPLLVRGDPGTGKSQLARAAAVALGRRFRSHAVDASTETRDLLWRLDSVARLAEAQMLGGLQRVDEEQARRRLEARHFIEPGPLWWGFDWNGAARQDAVYHRREPVVAPDAGRLAQGCVVLIDEIDKADSAVPNGLLEALGNRRFEVHGVDRVAMDDAWPPLVVITTNEERALPDAFVRRCLVLPLALPDKRDDLIGFLVARGQAHFGDRCGTDVLTVAADLVATDRGDPDKDWRDRGVAPPGLAEYIDLVGVVVERDATDEARRARLAKVRGFALRKHPGTRSP